MERYREEGWPKVEFWGNNTDGIRGSVAGCAMDYVSTRCRLDPLVLNADSERPPITGTLSANRFFDRPLGVGMACEESEQEQ